MLVLVLEVLVLVMLVLLVFNANYGVDVTEIAEIVRKFKFWKNVTDWLSEKVSTREAIASKNLDEWKLVDAPNKLIEL